MGRFDVYETIALIRPRPALYIGYHSLVRMSAFVDGCFHMAKEYGIECCEEPKLSGLHDWVAKRFGWHESTAGWRNIIFQESGEDDSKALDMFFELVEEFHSCSNKNAGTSSKGN